jgi:hypothetical protein
MELLPRRSGIPASADKNIAASIKAKDRLVVNQDTFSKGRIMNKFSLILSGVLALSGVAANAGELYTPEQYQSVSASTITRAEVKQELARARAAGELTFGDVDAPRSIAGPSTKTRAEVKREVLQARAAHELHFGDVDFPNLASSDAAGKSPAKMRHEPFVARKAESRAHDGNLYSN